MLMGGGGLQRMPGVPGTSHHEQVCGILGTVWVPHGGALGSPLVKGINWTPTWSRHRWSHGLSVSARTWQRGYLPDPGVRPWPCGQVHPIGSGCQVKHNTAGLLTRPGQATRHTFGLVRVLRCGCGSAVGSL